jgi:hypothetical protein
MWRSVCYKTGSETLSINVGSSRADITSLVILRTAVCSSKNPHGGPEVVVIKFCPSSAISRSIRAVPKEDKFNPVKEESARRRSFQDIPLTWSSVETRLQRRCLALRIPSSLATWSYTKLPRRVHFTVQSDICVVVCHGLAEIKTSAGREADLCYFTFKLCQLLGSIKQFAFPSQPSVSKASARELARLPQTCNTAISNAAELRSHVLILTHLGCTRAGQSRTQS